MSIYDMQMNYHTLIGLKLDKVKKYISERYSSIEFNVQYEDDIVKTLTHHDKKYEALIIINIHNVVKSCVVKLCNKNSYKNKSCIIC